jgi:hypothetical protein
MPFFAVVVHGAGIRMPSPDGERPVVGFYTSRVTWGKNEPAAVAKALASVRRVWAEPKYAGANVGGDLELSADSCNPVGFVQWLRAPNRGHAFYPVGRPFA